jgi:glycosyltransferase involved in cell wall biosynthesis
MSVSERVSKADLHIHSKHSNRPSEWFLRKIGAPESFVEPRALYENCRRQGMDFVTISDHNTIDGALEIADLPNTFISCEVTTYFPEDGCKIHFLVIGITEHWFKDIDALRPNIYELRDYVVANNIIHSVAHPLFRINDRLTIDHFEKLMLLFNRFEGINGSRCHRACALANAVMENLTPEMIAEMADRHGIRPLGETPWKKTFTAGSDDHSGLYATNAHTITPHASTVVDYLEHLRAGRHWTGGGGGTSLRLAHSFYHIAYSYYASRFLGRTSRDSSLIGAMLQRMAGEQTVHPETGGFRAYLKRPIARLTKGLKRRRLNETERFIVDEFEKLTTEQQNGQTGTDLRNFEVASRISHQLTYSFLQKFVSEIKRGNLLESLQSISSLGPVAMGIAPYLTAFHTQHKDEVFLRQLAAHYPATRHLTRKSGRRLWVTDTLGELNGVARTIEEMATAAARCGEEIVVATCMDEPPRVTFPHHNFTPVGTVHVPEYPDQALAFPPFLDVLEYIEREGFDELIISTPGPLGLAALAAGRLFGLDVKGIYHTDFPRYIGHFTDDEALAELTAGYMAWFYRDMKTVFVSSADYRGQLMDCGVPPERLADLPHGVNLDQFSPEYRDPGFWTQVGVNGGFKFLYVGRLSLEKNLEALCEAFLQVHNDEPTAELVLVGEGPDAKRLQKTYAVPQISFTGPLHGEALARAYAGADIFVFPSLTDTFGNAVLEAQASGLPAIVANEGGPREIVRAGETGEVVDPRQVGAWTATMLHLMRNHELRQRMSENARLHAREKSWDQSLAYLLETDSPGPR